MNVPKNTYNLSPKMLEILELALSDEIKVVSFDVFDTLLLRPLTAPADLYDVVGAVCGIKFFREKRIAAEAETRRRKSVYIDDVTIEQIYDTYADIFTLSDEERESIMQTEMQVEYDVLHPRKSVKCLYDTVKAAGKTIFIISDMYLPSEFIAECLNKNGYLGWDRLYVSSETQVTKGTGRMYEMIARELKIRGIKNDWILHIGDNKKSDVNQAKKFGFQSAWIPKPIDVWNNCNRLKVYKDFIFSTKLVMSNNSLLYGITANLYFDDPFIEFNRGTYYNNEPRLLGYYMAPLLIGFTKWLIEEIEKDGIEQFVFIWRDGYLPFKLFNMLRPYLTEREIETKKLYLSRAMRVPFVADERDGLTNLILSLNENITVGDFIKNFFRTENEAVIDDIFNTFFSRDYLSLSESLGSFNKTSVLIKELSRKFSDVSENFINAVNKYIFSVLKPEKKLGFFDRSPRGALGFFLRDKLKIDSFQMYSSEGYDTEYVCQSNYLSYGMRYAKETVNVWSAFFERIISDQNPAIKDVVMDGDGNAQLVFDSPENEVPYCEEVELVQNGIVEYAQILTQILGKYLRFMRFERFGLFDFTVKLLSNPSKDETNLNLNLNLNRGKFFSTNSNNVIYYNWMNAKFKTKSPDTYVGEVMEFFEKMRVFGWETANRLGILTPARKLYRMIVGKKDKSFTALESEIEENIDKLKNIFTAYDNSEQKTIILLSQPLPIVKNFINELVKALPEYRFIFFGTSFAIRRVNCSMLSFTVPNEVNTWGDLSYSLPAKNKKTSTWSAVMRDSAQKTARITGNKNTGILTAYLKEHYFASVFEITKPVAVLMWNPASHINIIAKEKAEKQGIPVFAFESGFFPDTFWLSPKWFGDDAITTHPELFINKTVTKKELKVAEDAITYQRLCCSNRYSQQSGVFEPPDNGKKNVFYAGTCDTESEMVPYTEYSKKYYSPIFDSSQSAMLELSKIAKKNNWNLIYKPHPGEAVRIAAQGKLRIPKNVIYVEAGDINEIIDASDVIVTLLSGVSYVALIRKKAVLMLGYTPLRGKNCTYEAFEKKNIEPTLKEALEKGYTPEQEMAFTKHIAQMNKYVLFDNLRKREVRYGRSVEEAADMIKQTIERTERGSN